jgi:nitroreductase
MSIKIKDKSPKEYLVLGAANSGTSFISKLLEEAGVRMNNTKSRWHNKFFEDRKFRWLNAEILKKADSDTGKIPKEEKILAVDANDQIKALIKERKGDAKMWGFKDPRTSLTGKKYLPFLKDDTYLICMFRKPGRVLNRWREQSRFPEGNEREILNETNRSIINIIQEFSGLKDMALTQTIKKRRSVRKFKSDAVPEKIIKEVIDLAKKAPSAGAIRGYTAFVCQQPLDRIQAPVYIVICTNPEVYARRYGDRGKNLYAVQDATIFGAYLQLLLVERGLDSCWIGAFREGRIQRLLKTALRPIAILALGYRKTL